jgi:hypothetical protein
MHNQDLETGYSIDCSFGHIVYIYVSTWQIIACSLTPHRRVREAVDHTRVYLTSRIVDVVDGRFQTCSSSLRLVLRQKAWDLHIGAVRSAPMWVCTSVPLYQDYPGQAGSALVPEGHT